jgi:hypothetical protein
MIGSFLRGKAVHAFQKVTYVAQCAGDAAVDFVTLPKRYFTGTYEFHRKHGAHPVRDTLADAAFCYGFPTGLSAGFGMMFFPFQAQGIGIGPAACVTAAYVAAGTLYGSSLLTAHQLSCYGGKVFPRLSARRAADYKPA